MERHAHLHGDHQGFGVGIGKPNDLARAGRGIRGEPGPDRDPVGVRLAEPREHHLGILDERAEEGHLVGDRARTRHANGDRRTLGRDVAAKVDRRDGRWTCDHQIVGGARASAGKVGEPYAHGVGPTVREEDAHGIGVRHDGLAVHEGFRHRVGDQQGAAAPEGEVTREPCLIKAVLGTERHRLDRELAREVPEPAGKLEVGGHQRAEGGGWRRAGRAGDVGHVHAVSEHPQRRLSVERGGNSRPQEVDLTVLPGDDLFVVPADLDAGFGGGGDGIPVADDGIVRLGLVDMHNLGEPVIVGLGLDRGLVQDGSDARVDGEEDRGEDLARAVERGDARGVLPDLAGQCGRGPVIGLIQLDEQPSTVLVGGRIVDRDRQLVTQAELRGQLRLAHVTRSARPT